MDEGSTDVGMYTHCSRQQPYNAYNTLIWFALIPCKFPSAVIFFIFEMVFTYMNEMNRFASHRIQHCYSCALCEWPTIVCYSAHWRRVYECVFPFRCINSISGLKCRGSINIVCYCNCTNCTLHFMQLSSSTSRCSLAAQNWLFH